MTVVNLINYCHRRSIVDVAGVLDTPLKLVTIKIFKRSNCKIMSKAKKTNKIIFPGGSFSGGIFPRGRGGVIFRGYFSGGIFPNTEYSLKCDVRARA